MKLSATNLTINRGGACVLKGISGELEPGTITAIVGPNGAGKSSLLLALAGLLAPAEGCAAFDGRDLTAMAPQERAKAIGFLPQSAEISWDVAVENIVALGRLPHRDAGRAAIEAAIDALSLGDLRKRPASKLSGGEKARVLLARVLAGEPRWILADEPLAALDLGHQLGLIAHFKSCAAAQDGQGVVIVLHDLALAMNHADRVIVLHEGRLVADGLPADALSEATIAAVWGVETSWIGKHGQRALVASQSKRRI